MCDIKIKPDMIRRQKNKNADRHNTKTSVCIVRINGRTIFGGKVWQPELVIHQ